MVAVNPAAQTFWGYRRVDGTVGVRNHLVVIPSVICANTVAQRIADLIPGAIAIPHPHGCAQVGDDVVLTEKVLAGAAANPNVGAALIVGLGCETCQSTQVADLARAQAPGRLLESFSIQEAGGSIKAISHGVEVGKAMMAAIAPQRREELPLSSLVVATVSGGLDRSSVLASHPTVGAVADHVGSAGGTVLLAQTASLIGAGEALAQRAAGPDVARRVRELLAGAGRERLRARAKGGLEGDGDGRGPNSDLPDQAATSLSLAGQAGSQAVAGVLAFADRPGRPGVYLMDAPAQETVAVSAMAAAGAQVCLHSTGRGSPVGNALTPVIKVCGNPQTVERMADNVDFDTTAVLSGERTAAGLGADLYRQLLDVCSGQLTNSELIGHQEFAIHRIGPTV